MDSSRVDDVSRHATGVAGGSAQNAFERSVAEHNRRLEDRWGTGIFGSAAKKLLRPPRSSRAWLQGAEGQRKVAGRLADELVDTALILHDRDIAGADTPLDHLVIAPSGIWMVDSKDYAGELEASAGRLMVNGFDRGHFVTDMAARRAEIERAVASLELEDCHVQQAICFVSSEWQFFPTNCVMQDVRIVWPKKLIELINAPGSLTAGDVLKIGEKLSSGLSVSV